MKNVHDNLYHSIFFRMIRGNWVEKALTQDKFIRNTLLDNYWWKNETYAAEEWIKNYSRCL